MRSEICAVAFAGAIGLSACAGGYSSPPGALGSSVALKSQAMLGETNASQSVSPNLYKLSGGGITLTYSPFSTPGLPKLIYQDSYRRLQFTDDQIRAVEVPDIGRIVSVTLALTVDTGSTTFSVLLPQVNLPPHLGASAKIETEGITTIHRFSVVPSFNQGQREVSTLTPLCGSASSVIVPL